jgi:hypothetical protein
MTTQRNRAEEIYRKLSPIAPAMSAVTVRQKPWRTG